MALMFPHWLKLSADELLVPIQMLGLGWALIIEPYAIRYSHGLDNIEFGGHGFDVEIRSKYYAVQSTVSSSLGSRIPRNTEPVEQSESTKEL